MVLRARLHERQLDWSSRSSSRKVPTLLQRDLQANSRSPRRSGLRSLASLLAASCGAQRPGHFGAQSWTVPAVFRSGCTARCYGLGLRAPQPPVLRSLGRQAAAG